MNENGIIKILVVDDHAVVRSGLSAFLMVHDDLELVGEASNGKEAVEKCAKLCPDVVLMDLMMPVMDGAEATREIRKACPDTQVIILTSFKEKNLVEEALQAGAIGYLLKDVDVDDLTSAVRSAKHGKPTLSPEATQALINVAKQGSDHENELTAREKEILNLMILGLSNPEIAGKLVVSRSTVKFHVSSILAKLDVGTRTEAVALAIQNKLVDV